MSRPRKNGERHPCGKLKQNHQSSLPIAAWKRVRETVAKSQSDPRLGSEVGKYLIGGELTDTEAAVAEEVAKIYGRYEKLHGKRRSAASPSYEMGWSDGPGLADERMTSEQVTTRDKRERAIEDAFMALQDEMTSEARGARAALEQLCVENHPVPGWLPEVKKVLRRLAPKWQKTKPVPAKKLLTYDPKYPDSYLDPRCEIVGRAVKIISPLPVDEVACRLMVVEVVEYCRIAGSEIRPAAWNAEEDLASRVSRLVAAEKALSTLPRIYKRLAFQDQDDFDNAAAETIERLVQMRERLETLARSYSEARPGHRRGRPSETEKLAAASYAYCCLIAYSERPPTLTSPGKAESASGSFFELASVIYEGATGKKNVSLEWHCKEHFKERNPGPSDPTRANYHAELRRGLRKARQAIEPEAAGGVNDR